MYWPGVYRLTYQGEVYEGYYDCETNTIGPFKFPAVYAYSEANRVRLKDMVDDRFEPMFSALLRQKDLLAVILVNSNFYLKCYVDGVVMTDLSGNVKKTANGYYNYSEMIPKDIIPVGFSKTYVRSIIPLIPPARIFYSPSKRALLYDKIWNPITYEPEIQKGKSAYIELVKKSDKRIVINTEDGLRFID